MLVTRACTVVGRVRASLRDADECDNLHVCRPESIDGTRLSVPAQRALVLDLLVGPLARTDRRTGRLVIRESRYMRPT